MKMFHSVLIWLDFRGMLHSLVQSSLDSSFLGLSEVINTKVNQSIFSSSVLIARNLSAVHFRRVAMDISLLKFSFWDVLYPWRCHLFVVNGRQPYPSSTPLPRLSPFPSFPLLLVSLSPSPKDYILEI